MKTLLFLNSPTDFRATLHVDGFNRDCVLVQLKGREEAAARKLLDWIFQDLDCIGGDDELIPSYLEGIEEPLKELRSIQLGLMAVVRPLVWRKPTGEVALRGNGCSYALYPLKGYIGVGAVEDPVFHRLSSPCEEASTLLKEVITGTSAASLMVARSAMEARMRSAAGVNWCPKCCPDQVVVDTGGLPEHPVEALLAAAGMIQEDNVLCSQGTVHFALGAARKFLGNIGSDPASASLLRGTTGRERLITARAIVHVLVIRAIERGELTHAERLQALALLLFLSNPSYWGGDHDQPMISCVGENGAVTHLTGKDYVSRLLAAPGGGGDPKSEGERRSIVVSEAERTALLSLADGSCHPVLDGATYERLLSSLLAPDGGELAELDRKFRETAFILQETIARGEPIPPIKELATRVGIPRGWFYGESKKGERFKSLLENFQQTQKLGKGPAKGARNSRTQDMEAVDDDQNQESARDGEGE
jgi:hypothetical protein